MRPLVGGLAEPGGIVVLEAIPPAPAPQLQAFVWCRHHGNKPTLRGEARPARLPGVLMVGRFRVGSVNPKPDEVG
jgi:hypothetical protein